MLQDLCSDHLPILRTVPLSLLFCPNKCLFYLFFRKLIRMALLFTLTLTVLPQRNTPLSLFSAGVLFTFRALNAAKFSIPFGHAKSQPHAWWSLEEKEAVSKRQKASAMAHRRDEDHQAYISASQQALSVITETKAEGWQATCSSLSPISMYSLACSVPGSSSSFANFPIGFSPRESVSVFANYLRSIFLFPSQQPDVTGQETSSPSSTKLHTMRSLIPPPASPLNFSWLPTTTGPDKVAYPILKHIPCSGMDFLLHIFNLS